MIRSQFRPLIDSLAASRQLDPDLLEAQILVESADNPLAFRYEPDFYRRYLQGKPEWLVWGPLAACSYGLLQIMGAVAIELGFQGSPTALFHPNTNLFWGVRKLAQLRDQCGGNLHAALAAYNGGVRENRQPPFRNAAYLRKVLDTHTQITGVLHA